MRVFDRYLTGLAPELVTRICAVAVPLAPRRTTGQLARLLHRMVTAADPDAADRWYKRGIQRRDMIAYPAADGTITITANGLPADAACVRIQDIAEAAKRAGHPGRIGQIRCDVLLGLLDGRFTGMTTAQVITALLARHDGSAAAGGPPAPGAGAGGESGDDARGQRSGSNGRNAHGRHAHDSTGTGDGTGRDATPRDDRRGIEVRIGLATLLGLDEHPGEIPGLGPLVAPAARVRVALQRRAQWRFAVTDTDGQLLSEGVTRQRPTPARGTGGPPGGIVELHIPLTLLDELVANPTPPPAPPNPRTSRTGPATTRARSCDAPHHPSPAPVGPHHHPRTLTILPRSENARRQSLPCTDPSMITGSSPRGRPRAPGGPNW